MGLSAVSGVLGEICQKMLHNISKWKRMSEIHYLHIFLIIISAAIWPQLGIDLPHISLITMGMELPEPTVVLLYVAWRTLVQNLTSLNWEPITPHIDKFYVTVKSDTPSVYLHKTNIDGIIFICHVRFINENNNVEDFEMLQFAIDAF